MLLLFWGNCWARNSGCFLFTSKDASSPLQPEMNGTSAGEKSAAEAQQQQHQHHQQQQQMQFDIDPVLGVRSLSYWHKLISLMVSVIEDDRKHYAPVLNQ